MSTETQQQQAPVASKAAPEAATTAPAAENEVADSASVPVENGVPALEAGVAGIAIAQSTSELHRACAEGRLDDVRAILQRGAGGELEMLDMATGMTPIVLAIQAGHVDVVRELLNAGAVVPPPQVTMDPVMLSILYPQPTMYGMPPHFAQMAPPPFFQQQGFFPAPVRTPPGAASANGAAGAAAANGSPNSAANLPPAEVAKTIPCRNFPNCKYGSSCIFFHPRMQPGFFPPYGYEGGFVPYPSSAPFFPGSQDFVPGAADASTATADAAAAGDAATATQHDSIPAQAQQGAHVPSAGAPAFVPGMTMADGSFPGAGYAMGPLSPSLLPTPPPPMPNDPAFFATSPPQFQGFVPNGYPGHGRRPSFGQPFAAGGPPPKPFHGKKLSFSGGPKPWGPGGRPGGSSHLGQWKDGHPPPCAFFREGKCRNGDICKFPHIDAEGNDVRHPDVIRGIMAPAPTRPPPRHLRMMGGGGAGHYDPRHQNQQMHFAHGKAAAAAPVEETPEGEAAATAEAPAATDAVAATESSSSAAAIPAAVAAPAAAPAAPAAVADKEQPTPASSLPPKPSSSVPNSRSGSQAGIARVHANGVSSRSHSPNGAANGVRRGPRAYPNGHANGSRSSSTGGENKKPVPPQRVPRADEFPALGLKGGSGAVTPSTERREMSWGAKTAAQVLSEPAPAKPEAEAEEVKVAEEANDAAVAPSPVTPTATATEESVTMDSDSEQDAVIVSVSTTPNPEVAKAKLVSAVSFAAVAMGTPEAAPVALKA